MKMVKKEKQQRRRSQNTATLRRKQGQVNKILGQKPSRSKKGY